jgi:hypothetical protein
MILSEGWWCEIWAVNVSWVPELQQHLFTQLIQESSDPLLTVCNAIIISSTSVILGSWANTRSFYLEYVSSFSVL